MKAEEMFAASVTVMKELLTSKGMMDSMSRSKLRKEEENMTLLLGQRAEVNELVRKIAEAGGPGDVIAGASEQLIDAMVLRYLRNREIFMKTFPKGIEDIDPGPVSIWAAIMISPQDEITTV
jgi:hypothetical protein